MRCKRVKQDGQFPVLQLPPPVPHPCPPSKLVTPEMPQGSPASLTHILVPLDNGFFLPARLLSAHPIPFSFLGLPSTL
ncbi:hypothetical protein E2C01_093862 [Portunus trituberculatus]|uniref:Uncharacterized protein n=1 Tax=Portunus trituberculatus TaxID=210409 RepID=A0A5B7JUL9_PORTR|nr:hypothetical protein [Portunus trituberculatus]